MPTVSPPSGRRVHMVAADNIEDYLEHDSALIAGSCEGLQSANKVWRSNNPATAPILKLPATTHRADE
jgi:hypothetical protein